jgi:hypothetical protein
MIMRPAVTKLLVAVVLLCCTAASATSIEVGYVDDAGLDRWLAGGPAEFPTGETSCKPAKFGESSACGNLVISNHSAQAITVSFTTASDKFWMGLPGAFGFGAPPNVPLPCSAMNVRGYLRPGRSCYEQVRFWPYNGDVSHGTIQVIVKTATGSVSTDFKFKGTSDYQRELQAAEVVRQRHEAELMKLPHVTSVELDNDDKGAIKIDVKVSDTDGIKIKHDIEAVRSQVPQQIEGYQTEVAQFAFHAYFL